MLESHNNIIKGRAVVADDWSVLRLDLDLEHQDQKPGQKQDPATAVVPPGKIIVPLALWLAQRETLAGRDAVGVWIGADERPETLKGQLDQFAVVAVDFPKFTDGRGYSIAYNLRMRLGYQGELRAIGDVLRDQLFAMHRVGFDAFATRPDRSITDALKGLTDFSETYQSSVDQKLPLYRRQERDVRSDTSDIGYGI